MLDTIDTHVQARHRGAVYRKFTLTRGASLI